MKKVRKLLASLLCAAMIITGSMPVMAAEQTTPVQTPTYVAPKIDVVTLINYYIQHLDVEGYKKKNPDLVTVFGNDVPMYILHYVLCGIPEGRATATWDPVAYVVNNGDKIGQSILEGKSDFFNIAKYKATYPQLEAFYGADGSQYLAHYLTEGILAGEISGGTFDPVTFAKKYPNAAVRTNVVPTDFAKAVKAEQNKPTAVSAVSSSSGSSATSASGSSSSSSSSSSGGSSSSGTSKPVNETVTKIAFRMQQNGSEKVYEIEIPDTGLEFKNENDLYFKELWLDLYSDYQVNLVTYVGDKVKDTYPLTYTDFTIENTIYTATLKLDKYFFKKDVKFASTVPSKLIITYEPEEIVVEEGVIDNYAICMVMEDESENPTVKITNHPIQVTDKSLTTFQKIWDDMTKMGSMYIVAYSGATELKRIAVQMSDFTVDDENGVATLKLGRDLFGSETKINEKAPKTLTFDYTAVTELDEFKLYYEINKNTGEVYEYPIADLFDLTDRKYTSFEELYNEVLKDSLFIRCYSDGVLQETIPLLLDDFVIETEKGYAACNVTNKLMDGYAVAEGVDTRLVVQYIYPGAEEGDYMMGKSLVSPTIKLLGNEYIMPCKVSDFEANGWSVVDNKVSTGSITITKNNIKIDGSVEKTDEGSLYLTRLYVTSKDDPEYTYNGIKLFNSTLEDIISKFGDYSYRNTTAKDEYSWTNINESLDGHSLSRAMFTKPYDVEMLLIFDKNNGLAKTCVYNFDPMSGKHFSLDYLAKVDQKYQKDGRLTMHPYYYGINDETADVNASEATVTYTNGLILKPGMTVAEAVSSGWKASSGCDKNGLFSTRDITEDIADTKPSGTTYLYTEYKGAEYSIGIVDTKAESVAELNICTAVAPATNEGGLTFTLKGKSNIDIRPADIVQWFGMPGYSETYGAEFPYDKPGKYITMCYRGVKFVFSQGYLEFVQPYLWDSYYKVDRPTYGKNGDYYCSKYTNKFINPVVSFEDLGLTYKLPCKLSEFIGDNWQTSTWITNNWLKQKAVAGKKFTQTFKHDGYSGNLTLTLYSVDNSSYENLYVIGMDIYYNEELNHNVTVNNYKFFGKTRASVFSEVNANHNNSGYTALSSLKDEVFDQCDIKLGIPLTDDVITYCEIKGDYSKTLKLVEEPNDALTSFDLYTGSKLTGTKNSGQLGMTLKDFCSAFNVQLDNSSTVAPGKSCRKEFKIEDKWVYAYAGNYTDETLPAEKCRVYSYCIPISENLNGYHILGNVRLDDSNVDVYLQKLGLASNYSDAFSDCRYEWVDSNKYKLTARFKEKSVYEVTLEYTGDTTDPQWPDDKESEKLVTGIQVYKTDGSAKENISLNETYTTEEDISVSDAWKKFLGDKTAGVTFTFADGTSKDVSLDIAKMSVDESTRTATVNFDESFFGEDSTLSDSLGTKFTFTVDYNQPTITKLTAKVGDSDISLTPTFETTDKKNGVEEYWDAYLNKQTAKIVATLSNGSTKEYPLTFNDMTVDEDQLTATINFDESFFGNAYQLSSEIPKTFVFTVSYSKKVIDSLAFHGGQAQSDKKTGEIIVNVTIQVNDGEDFNLYDSIDRAGYYVTGYIGDETVNMNVSSNNFRNSSISNGCAITAKDFGDGYTFAEGLSMTIHVTEEIIKSE